MKNQIIAKRYAKALFNLAQDGGWVGQYGRELSDVVKLLKDVPGFSDAIQNRLYPEAVRKSVFTKIAGEMDLSVVVRSFISLLIEKKRVQHLPEIADFYNKLIDEHSNIAHAQLTAAAELDAATIQDIASSLEKVTGKKIVVDFKTDPALIGGVVARIGDMVLDGSVRRQLLSFKENMKRGALG